MNLLCEDKSNEIKNTKPFNYTVTLLSQQKLHACTEKCHLMLFASKTKARLSCLIRTADQGMEGDVAGNGGGKADGIG